MKNAQVFHRNYEMIMEYKSSKNVNTILIAFMCHKAMKEGINNFAGLFRNWSSVL